MYSDIWAEWHADHERRRSAPYGFLAVTGLHWLDAWPQRFAGIPGEWSSSPGGVTVTLRDGEQLTLGDQTSGAPAAGDGAPGDGALGDGALGDGAFGEAALGEGALGDRTLGDRTLGDRTLGPGVHDLGKVDEDGVTVAFGDAIAEIARRGEGIIVRPRHPENQLRLAYEGTPAFPPSEHWLVPARFVPLDAVQSVSLATVVDGLLDRDVAVGRVDFEVGGVALSLTVFPGAAPDSLTTLFTDTTSGVTTYPASRRLDLPAPAADGTLTIDFNRATNLPCAYTPFATCALAPPENRLPIAITAGEKSPLPARADDRSRSDPITDRDDQIRSPVM